LLTIKLQQTIGKVLAIDKNQLPPLAC